MILNEYTHFFYDMVNASDENWRYYLDIFTFTCIHKEVNTLFLK